MERPLTGVWSFFHPQSLLSLLESPFASLSASPFASLSASPFASLSASPYADKMADPDTGIFGALGAVLGYVGAEAATGQIFERLLWPQRSYANITPESIPILAILMPMGGPLHIVALKALDILFAHGLFKGAQVGHMLGTAFYPDQEWTYTSWTSNGQKVKTESVRNCLWVRALSYIPIPKLGYDTQQATDQTPGQTSPRPDKIRAKVAVSHLIFTKATRRDVESKMPFVKADVGRSALQVFLAIVITELSAILTAVFVTVFFKSLWGLWWLAPLILRLVSALFAVDRKPLGPLELASPNDDICDYEIHCPQSEGNFMLLTGPRSIVQQFFVHYGHPVRNRLREAVQLAMVVLFGLLFLSGLLFSVICMPIEVQKVWVCYHLYSGFAMIVMRYTSSSTSTEAMIAEHFRKQEESSSTAYGEKEETAILFGHTRDGSETMKVSFIPTYHNRFLEGQACMDTLLRRTS
ncbi:hypothetical protein HDV63DRAFT_376409 [Trichoderma sp. SZMC 28014]